MGIDEIASDLDIGFVLAEATGTFIYHGMKVDKENGTIDICYSPITPINNITITMTTGSKITCP